MLRLVRPSTGPAPEAGPPIDELLERMGLDERLSERLAQDAEGRPFEPFQIDQSQDLMAQLAVLLRREPLGGAEQQIRDNQRQTQELLAAGLNSVLAQSTTTPRTLLAALLAAARRRKEACEAELRELDRRFEAVQARLQPWQERAGQRSESLGGDILRWFVGGAGRLSLPEAASLVNEREHVALWRAAHLAAQSCFASGVEQIGRLLEQLDERIAEARQLALTLNQEREQLQPASLYAPWTLQLDTWLLAQSLAERADGELALAALLKELTSANDAALAEQVRAVAQASAERILQTLSLSDLLNLEAGTAADSDADGLVVVGQVLLEAVAQPSWQLTRRARPRIETVQVTPDGAPLYSLEGLGSAAYGSQLDRMGFVQLQLGVAVGELALVAEGEEAFQATLAQRNLYLLDELARANSPTALAGPPRVMPRPVTLPLAAESEG